MNQEWVDRWLESPGLRSETVGKAKWDLFEPTSEFYARLGSGDEDDLTWAAHRLGQYLDLSSTPSVVYEWSLRVDAALAGLVQQNLVRIPLFYAGRPHALGAILAHELTHKVLECSGISCSMIEFEPLTDLASIALGLGKLVLNGTIVELVAAMGEIQSLGYLAPELKVYAYLKVNQWHRVPNSCDYPGQDDSGRKGAALK